jgi:hypothetical protein
VISLEEGEQKSKEPHNKHNTNAVYCHQWALDHSFMALGSKAKDQRQSQKSNKAGSAIEDERK